MAVLLALATAVTYGTADFLGGIATRRAHHVFAVVLLTQSSGLVLVLALAPFVDGSVAGRDVAIAAAGGILGLAGLLCFYRSLSIGPMSVAAPVSAVLAALVPLVVGVAGGERPDPRAWVGFALALVAIAALTRDGSESSSPVGVTSSVLVLSTGAGIGFGSFFVALERVSDDAGLWPVAIARAASVLVVAVIVVSTRTPARVGRAALPVALVCGAFDTMANVFVLLAYGHGDLSTVSVISSLYPAATVVLAMVVLRERATRLHLGGGTLALVAVGLIALGQPADPASGDDATSLRERRAAVTERGAPVMGFDLQRTTHHFVTTDDGGVQTVVADDPDDLEQIEIVRTHLADEADRFAAGDFDDPAHIHGDAMPGLAVLREAGDRLAVAYAEVPGGARITYRSDDPEIVRALHDWFAAQLHDHGDHAADH